MNYKCSASVTYVDVSDAPKYQYKAYDNTEKVIAERLEALVVAVNKMARAVENLATPTSFGFANCGSQDALDQETVSLDDLAASWDEDGNPIDYYAQR
jgi:hypothetical protein